MKTAAQRVEEWNRKFNIGDTVGVIRSNGKISITTIRERAAVVCAEPAVWLEGISSCYSLDLVREVEFLTRR